MNLAVHLGFVLAAPIFGIGLINRTKALWAGRRGPRMHQFYRDLRRLLRKVPVYSEVSTPIFRLAPWIVLATSLLAALLSPIAPGYAPFPFAGDFVYFAYLLALGRVFMILGALDTGSSFEGMGASREATYSALIEPAFFLVLGTLGLATGADSFQDLVGSAGTLAWPLRLSLVIALLILLQIEAARLPVDDPQTHLELTMIHEVMILDHSGPELAALQYGSAVKMIAIAGVIAALVNPVSVERDAALSWALAAAGITGILIAVGLVESWVARLRLSAVPAYAFAATLAGAAALAGYLAWPGGAP